MINPPFLYVVKEKSGINAPLAMGGAENKGAKVLFGVT